MKPELKSCPFCGEKNNLFVQYCEGTVVHPAYRVYCDNCGASSGYVDKANHVDNWNSRASAEAASVPSVDIEETLKQLEALMHRVSKAALVVGYGGERGETMLNYAEDMFKSTARKLLTQSQEQQLSSAPTSNKAICGAQNENDTLQNPWKACIDHELVTLGSTADSYESPEQAIQDLLDWHVSIAVDPVLNGGFKLVPVEPTIEMINAGWADDEISLRQRWKAMLEVAPQPKEPN